MNEKTASSLQALRKVSAALLEDVVEGNPTKRINQHVWAISKAVSDFLEATEMTGKHQRNTSQDAPSLAADHPGGTHKKTKFEEVITNFFNDKDKRPRGQGIEEPEDRDLSVNKVESVADLLAVLNENYKELCSAVVANGAWHPAGTIERELTAFYEEIVEGIGELMEAQESARAQQIVGETEQGQEPWMADSLIAAARRQGTTTSFCSQCQLGTHERCHSGVFGNYLCICWAYRHTLPAEVVTAYRVNEDQKFVDEAAQAEGLKMTNPDSMRSQEEVGKKFLFRLEALISRIDFTEGDRSSWQIETALDQALGWRPYLQVKHYRRDINTGEYAWGSGGKRYLSPHATDSEIVKQVLAAFLAYQEHEVRENFLLDGIRLFSPHIDVAALQVAAEELDRRGDQ